MANPTFQTRQGLNVECPGARFRGALIENTEEEYGMIDWQDVRQKPLWNDVEASALNILRRRIARNLNERTSQLITEEFRTSLAPDTVIQSTFEWQFNMMNLWLAKDTGLYEFPYDVHVGMNIDASFRYITVASPNEMQQLYLEMFNHISDSLASGRVEKDKLRSMTRTQLEEYRDVR